VVYRLNNKGISVKNQGCKISGFHPCIVEVLLLLLFFVFLG